MAGEPKTYVKLHRKGRSRGLQINIYEALLRTVLKIRKLDGIPESELRYKREYSEKTGTILIAIRHITKIDDVWLDKKDRALKKKLLKERKKK